MTKRANEPQVEDAEKVSVRLTNYADYHHLEDDQVKHSGDVVEVEAGRAVALIERGHAEAVSPSKKK